jgi:AraC family transcriptional regulator of adaptative response/methylated-DNA-[protein]-cysteine methyltransferase
MAGVIDYISAHLDEPLTLDVLGRVAGLSAPHFQRRFTTRFGLSPAEYIRAKRAERLKSGLREGSSVTASMLDAGYGSTSRLYEHGTAALGMTPRQYKTAGLGLVVHYAIFETELGWTAAATTDRGLCRVAFGDSPNDLERQLHEEFSNALLLRGRLEEYVAVIRSLAAGQGRVGLVPLDIRGTAFQLRVWKALTAIPRGETRSYRNIAAEIGEPTAVRAVAQACATNPVAVVVPCHRVVRSDGGTGGYRWGEARKKQLLESEKKHQPA